MSSTTVSTATAEPSGVQATADAIIIWVVIGISGAVALWVIAVFVLQQVRKSAELRRQERISSELNAQQLVLNFRGQVTTVFKLPHIRNRKLFKKDIAQNVASLLGMGALLGGLAIIIVTYTNPAEFSEDRTLMLWGAMLFVVGTNVFLIFRQTIYYRERKRLRRRDSQWEQEIDAVQAIYEDPNKLGTGSLGQFNPLKGRDTNSNHGSGTVPRHVVRKNSSSKVSRSNSTTSRGRAGRHASEGAHSEVEYQPSNHGTLSSRNALTAGIGGTLKHLSTIAESKSRNMTNSLKRNTHRGPRYAKYKPKLTGYEEDIQFLHWDFTLFNTIQVATIVWEFFQLGYFPFRDFVSSRGSEWEEDIQAILDAVVSITSLVPAVGSETFTLVWFWLLFSLTMIAAVVAIIFLVVGRWRRSNGMKEIKMYWVEWFTPFVSILYLPILVAFINPTACLINRQLYADGLPTPASETPIGADTTSPSTRCFSPVLYDSIGVYLSASLFGFAVAYLLFTLFLTSDDRKPRQGEINFKSTGVAFMKNMSLMLVIISLLLPSGASPAGSGAWREGLMVLILLVMLVYNVKNRPCYTYQVNATRTTILSLVLWATIIITLSRDTDTYIGMGDMLGTLLVLGVGMILILVIFIILFKSQLAHLRNKEEKLREERYRNDPSIFVGPRPGEVEPTLPVGLMGGVRGNTTPPHGPKYGQPKLMVQYDPPFLVWPGDPGYDNAPITAEVHPPADVETSQSYQPFSGQPAAPFHWVPTIPRRASASALDTTASRPTEDVDTAFIGGFRSPPTAHIPMVAPPQLYPGGFADPMLQPPMPSHDQSHRHSIVMPDANVSMSQVPSYSDSYDRSNRESMLRHYKSQPQMRDMVMGKGKMPGAVPQEWKPQPEYFLQRPEHHASQGERSNSHRPL